MITQYGEARWSDEQRLAWQRIEALDLRAVAAVVRRDLRFSVTTSWRSDEELDRLCAASEQRYRQYLFLRFRHPTWVIEPDIAIEIFWRTHVAHTANYRSDCDRVFGRFLDYAPREALDDVARHYATAKLANALDLEFGAGVPARAGDGPADRTAMPVVH